MQSDENNPRTDWTAGGPPLRDPSVGPSDAPNQPVGTRGLVEH